MNNFIANVILKGEIKTVTGLHIGGSKEKLEIGGVDLPVIRHPNNNYPYIPGSSIKGKMRMLMEYALGKVNSKGEVHSCQSADCPICVLFGTSAKEAQLGPTRLIIRDATPTADTIAAWKKVETDLLYTELKGENFINRITSEANPRFIERVLPDSAFKLEMVLGFYDINGKTDQAETIKYLLQGLRLLQDNFIGGYGSRGYGKITFALYPPIVLTVEDYQKGKLPQECGELKNLDEWRDAEIIELIQNALGR